MNIGPQGNKMQYVFTNPNKDAELFSCDKIFVLSQKPINEVGFKNLFDENLKAIQEFEERRSASSGKFLLIYICNFHVFKSLFF